MSTFTWSPSWGARLTVKPKTLLAQFGDGYEQRVGDGLNTQPRSWSVSFVRPVSEIQAIDNFLATAAGVSAFDWTPPTGTAGKWVCEKWDRDVTSPAAHTLSATFREVFEP